MFGKTADSMTGGAQSVIQEGVTIRGEVKSEGEIRIEGTLEGSIASKSRVVVGATGSVQADIDGSEIVIMGRVCGNIVGSRRIELRKGAHVEGDLSTQSLVIEEGVFFRGLSRMAPEQLPTPLPETKGPSPVGARDGGTRVPSESALFENAESRTSS
jgi:cytoskeletal protein CcmA (bactofilin family)